jgi:hypothetical protein
VAVASGVGDDQCGQVLGGLALVVGGVGDFDQADALQRGGLLGGGAAVAAGDEDVDVATDFWAAVTVLRVAALRLCWSCSAITRIVI